MREFVGRPDFEVSRVRAPTVAHLSMTVHDVHGALSESLRGLWSPASSFQPTGTWSSALLQW